MEKATSYYVANLNKHPEVLKYLKERGLEEKTIKDFRLGFADNEWREILNHLKQKGFRQEEIEKAGLIKMGGGESTKVANYYDRFRGRIMFPIADSSGRIIAFSGRLFEKAFPTSGGVGKPTEIVGSKYLNSPETPIFNKSAVLYGLDRAKDSIRRNNFSILVEFIFFLCATNIRCCTSHRSCLWGNQYTSLL